MAVFVTEKAHWRPAVDALLVVNVVDFHHEVGGIDHVDHGGRTQVVVVAGAQRLQFHPLHERMRRQILLILDIKKPD